MFGPASRDGMGLAQTEVLDLKHDLVVQAASIAWNGRIRAESVNFSSNAPYLVAYDVLAQLSGAISLVTTSGDIAINAGLYSASDRGLVGNGSGNITLTTASGAITTNGAGWVMSDPVKLDWALRGSKYDIGSIDINTGRFTVSGATTAEATLYLPNGSVIRNAQGAFIQSTGGRLTLASTLGVGAPLAGYLISPLSLFTNVASFTANVPAGRTGYITDIDDITNIAPSGGGNFNIVSLLGNQNAPQPINTNQEIVLISDSLNLSSLISTAFNIFVRPTDPTRRLYLVQSDAGSLVGLVLSQTELNNLVTSSTLFLGAADLRTPIVIGDGTSILVRFNNPTTILRADSVNITSPLLANNLIVYGDGTTMTIAESVAAASIRIEDSVLVSGSRSVSVAGSFNLVGTLDADSSDAALALSAGADVDITGSVGSARAFASLSISAGGSISLGSDVSVAGDLTLASAGSISIAGDVFVAGDLVIESGASVTFSGSLRVGGRVIVRAAGPVAFAASVQLAGPAALGSAAAPLGALSFAGPVAAADLSAYASTITASAPIAASALRLEAGSLTLDTVSAASAYLAATGRLALAGLSVAASAELVANQIDLLGAVSAASADATLTLRPYDSARAISIGANVLGAPASALRLDAADLAAIQPGFASLVIGDIEAGSGAVYLGRLGLLAGESTFRSPVTIAGGSVIVTRAIDLDARASELRLVARTGNLTVNGRVNAASVSARLVFEAAGNLVVNRGLHASESITLVAGGALTVNLPSATTGEISASALVLVAGGALTLNDGTDSVTLAADTYLAIDAASLVRNGGSVTFAGEDVTADLAASFLRELLPVLPPVDPAPVDPVVVIDPVVLPEPVVTLLPEVVFNTAVTATPSTPSVVVSAPAAEKGSSVASAPTTTPVSTPAPRAPVFVLTADLVRTPLRAFVTAPVVPSAFRTGDFSADSLFSVTARLDDRAASFGAGHSDKERTDDEDSLYAGLLADPEGDLS